MHRRVGFLLFGAGWGANHFATMLVVYKSQLGLAPSALGGLFGMYALGLVPGLLLAGRASDRRGRRALVLPASVVAIAASVLLAIGSASIPLLFVGRGLYGVAMGSIMSPGSVWVQEISGSELGPRRATLYLSAGFGFGPLFTGLLIELAPAPMILPFVMHILVMVLALVLVRPVPETASGAVTHHASNDPKEKLRAVKLLLLQIPVAPWAFAYPALSGAVLPNLLRQYTTHPALFSGTVLMAMVVVAVLVQPLTSRLGRHGDLVGLALGVAGFELSAMAVEMHSLTLVYVASFFLGGAYGIVITTGLKLISTHVSSAYRGTSVGVYYVITYIGFSIPLVYALLAKVHGDIPTLQGMALVGLACVPIRALVARFEEKRESK